MGPEGGGGGLAQGLGGWPGGGGQVVCAELLKGAPPPPSTVPPPPLPTPPPTHTLHNGGGGGVTACDLQAHVCDIQPIRRSHTQPCRLHSDISSWRCFEEPAADATQPSAGAGLTCRARCSTVGGCTTTVKQYLRGFDGSVACGRPQPQNDVLEYGPHTPPPHPHT